MEAALDRDAVSVAKMYTPAMDHIVVQLYHRRGGEPQALEVNSCHAVLGAVQRAFGVAKVQCWLGEDQISDCEATFADCGAEDGARFTVDTAAGMTEKAHPQLHTSP